MYLTAENWLPLEIIYRAPTQGKFVSPTGPILNSLDGTEAILLFIFDFSWNTPNLHLFRTLKLRLSFRYVFHALPYIPELRVQAVLFSRRIR